MRSIFILFVSSLLFISCSKPTDQDYMKKASESIKENKVSDAVQDYQSLLKEYPNSKLAPQALRELAMLYQNKMVKDVSETESLTKAAELYKSVFDKYPDSDIAPPSLFMSGFIEANDLRHYDKATAIYKTFLEKYPKHQLAASATEELKYMGLTPEQILQKKKSDSTQNL
jgi:TolA-binding protein